MTHVACKVSCCYSALVTQDKIEFWLGDVSGKGTQRAKGADPKALCPEKVPAEICNPM